MCGTTTAYKNGCRCDECRAARRQYDQDRYAAKGDAIKQRKCERRATDGYAINSRRRELRQANLAHLREQERKRYAANKQIRAQQKRDKRAADPEHVRKVQKDWRASTGKGRIYNAEYRARYLNAFVEQVDPLVVFENDNYVCQRCGIQCPIEAKWPRRDAATLDHIIALANGGEHSYANTQTLCFRCNSAKGNRE